MEPPKDSYAEDWLDRPADLLRQAQENPAAIDREISELDDALGHRAHSIVNIEALVMAVVEPSRREVVARLNTKGEIRDIDWALATQALVTESSKTQHEKNHISNATPLLYVAGTEAAVWDLPEAISEAIAASPGTRVLVVAPSLAATSPIERACDAFGLTSLERRVVVATLHAGNIRVGARAAGVSYATAREAISGALAKVGAPRLPGLVYRLSLLALGVFPNGGEAAHLLADRWGLRERQAQIALLLAEGLTREQTARALGLSPATVKKETDIIFEAMGVSSGAALARMVSAATSVQALSDASHDRVVWADHAAEPLRLIRRPSGGVIAISDFGPRSARPVLLTHACFSGRHPPRRLVQALIAAGYRPIAIDRPGYGLTDFDGAIGLEPRGEPFGAAAHDMAIVLDALSLKTTDVIGRGGAQAALAFSALYPARCGRVALIAPIPPLKAEVGWSGIFGAYREIYLRNPRMIAPSIRLMARLMSRRFVARMVRKSLANTPPDLHAAAMPGFDEDYYRTMQMYALGKLNGYIHEQSYLARVDDDGYRPESENIIVLQGDFDAVLNPERAHAYWMARLPRARFERATGQGRLLDYAVPDWVVAHLGKHVKRGAPT